MALIFVRLFPHPVVSGRNLPALADVTFPGLSILSPSYLVPVPASVQSLCSVLVEVVDFEQSHAFGASQCMQEMGGGGGGILPKGYTHRKREGEVYVCRRGPSQKRSLCYDWSPVCCPTSSAAVCSQPDILSVPGACFVFRFDI